MTGSTLRELALLSVRDPAEAARQILAQRLSRDILWIAFFLAVVLNALVQQGFSVLYPLIDAQVQPVFQPVWRMLAMSGGLLFMNIVAFSFIGRLIGGKGRFEGVMALMVWLQLLQAAIHAGVFAAVLLLPFLLTPLLVGVWVVSLYITLHFINQAHQFNSLGKSFLVIVLFGLAVVPFVLALNPFGLQ